MSQITVTVERDVNAASRAAEIMQALRYYGSQDVEATVDSKGTITIKVGG